MRSPIGINALPKRRTRARQCLWLEQMSEKMLWIGEANLALFHVTAISLLSLLYESKEKWQREMFD